MSSISAATSDNHDALDTHPCLLPLLQPVRFCLHTFLSADDAARLMRASRSITASLLSGYAFVDHAFTFHACSVTDVKRSIAFYARYHMRIVRMCLPAKWNEPLVDDATGRAVLPASLVALALGGTSPYERYRSLANAPIDESGGNDESEQRYEESYRRVRPHGAPMFRAEPWQVLEYAVCMGAFNQPIPPGALPHGLRWLQLGDSFNQPLQVGSIPETVETLQFGMHFDQLLHVGQLPASLTHLVFGRDYDQPLQLDVLPAGLKRLHLGASYRAPLQPGTLPPQLQQLSCGYRYTRRRTPRLVPGDIPPSVTHLRLSDDFGQPLQEGIIPHGVAHLNLGYGFNQPLPPGMLPTSLRELVLSPQFDQALHPGSLPDGLEVLAFRKRGKFQQTLQPDVIPASVVAISMSKDYNAEVVTGGIPATVQWLRLSNRYDEKSLRAMLSPATHVVWW